MHDKPLGQEYVGQSISWGTLRTEDLISAFSAACEAAENKGNLEPGTVGSLLKMYPNFKTDGEEAEWLLLELEDALDRIAPEGSYFGSSEGDGSDFGFWAIEEIEVSDVISG